MKLKILQAGEEVLRSETRKLTVDQIRDEKTQILIDYMIETLRDSPGVGLAAPQIGESLQIIVVEDKKDYQKNVSKQLLVEQKRKPITLKVIINPVLKIEKGDTAHHFEGCLSVDGYRAVVPRAERVTISGLSRHGKKVSYQAEGWLARIFQHECDHLQGRLYVNSMLPKTFMTEKLYTKYWAEKSVAELKEFIDLSQ